MNNETWLPIEGYPGYEISDLGRIRSRRYAPKNPNSQPRLRTLSAGKGGYLHASLRDKNKNVKTMMVHRLVLFTFVGPPLIDKPYALHKDSNPQNNCVENLYWGDGHDNMEDCRRAGHFHPKKGSNHPNAKLNEELAYQLKKDLAHGSSLRTCAKKYKLSIKTVAEIRDGVWWKHVTYP